MDINRERERERERERKRERGVNGWMKSFYEPSPQ